MLIVANPQEAVAILGAMRAVGDTDGASTLSDGDRHTLVAAAHYGLGLTDPVDPDAGRAVTPDELAAALGEPDVRDFATRF